MKPRFKVGDWVVCIENKPAFGLGTRQVTVGKRYRVMTNSTTNFVRIINDKKEDIYYPQEIFTLCKNKAFDILIKEVLKEKN